MVFTCKSAPTLWQDRRIEELTGLLNQYRRVKEIVMATQGKRYLWGFHHSPPKVFQLLLNSGHSCQKILHLHSEKMLCWRTELVRLSWIMGNWQLLGFPEILLNGTQFRTPRIYPDHQENKALNLSPVVKEWEGQRRLQGTFSLFLMWALTFVLKTTLMIALAQMPWRWFQIILNAPVYIS